MISSVYNNISALFAFGTKMGVNAGNLANVNTDEFKKSRADIVETSHGSVEARINRVDTPGQLYSEPGDPEIRQMSNVDIAEEVVQTIPIRHGYEANLKMISVYDELLGSVINIVK
ncbi:MAG: flagellar biosynthesis protein FlgC [Desulfobacteraceae bacterium]|nr:MAG: flagellar biosynthesis protein FlgC [Desulfobacteraceae bacterium]